MTLGQKQEAFSRKIMLLMMHIHALGYAMRGEMWLRCQTCPVGSPKSLHKSKLAFDITLSYSPVCTIRPKVLTGTAAEKAHNIIHDYWDSRGGAKRIPGDLNHYSLEHRGMR